MHWLKQWRMSFERRDGRTGLSRREMAKMVRVPGTISNPNKEIGCSETLIAILEGGGITHPAIANRIAEVTGATPEQRDMLVHKMHKGTWRPTAKTARESAKAAEAAKEIIRCSAGGAPSNAHTVVCLDRSGSEIGRYASMVDAAYAINSTYTAVYNRCNRKLKPKTNEFSVYGCTWRLADEWDSMTQEEKTNDLRAGGCRR